MQRIKSSLMIFGVLLYGSILGSALSAAEVKRGSLELKSSAFQAGSDIPRKHTCDANDVSPELSWGNVPVGTRAFAMITDDPDAPAGTWVHWVIYDLPADTKELAEGVPTTEALTNGAKQGTNDFRKLGYGGPCPPPGLPHRYFFKLYALDAPTGLKPRASKQQLLKAIENHVLGEAEIIGRYKR
ncbi:MAG: YbhB/YbcL family Raf kinase inhibitor-like protein [Deltaproteobacteria bacterium]